MKFNVRSQHYSVRRKAATLAAAIALCTVTLAATSGVLNSHSKTRGGSGGDPIVMSAYERLCSPGGYSTNLDLIESAQPRIPGVISGVECQHGDLTGSLSSLFVLRGNDAVRRTEHFLAGDGWGFTCFLVGPDWLMIGGSVIVDWANPVTVLQDFRTERKFLGGTIQGPCN